jgi:hypothetical protein
MAAEAALAGLRLGASQEESELLLQQTEEASAATMQIEGKRCREFLTDTLGGGPHVSRSSRLDATRCDPPTRRRAGSASRH